MPTSKHLVVSAVNFSDGGPLTVLQDSLDAAAKFLTDEWKITALVHSKTLIDNPRIDTREFPQSKGSWIRRIWLEWIVFGQLSKSLKPDLWLSLHDITPIVNARRQAVYCHNPSPFYKISWHEAYLEPSFALFNLLYRLLYGTFLSHNHAVVVQQDWLRKEFKRLYAHSNVVVAYPMKHRKVTVEPPQNISMRKFSRAKPLIIFYPALPRVFKNIEVLCEAMKFLSPELRGIVELRLTISGNENSYAREIYKRFSSVFGVRFIGRQTRLQMIDEYSACDVVAFPSKLETWGLPITEAKELNKPLLVADLPYAHETVGNCSAVNFLSATNALAWAKAFEQIACGQHIFCNQALTTPDAPFAADWTELWRLLTKDL